MIKGTRDAVLRRIQPISIQGRSRGKSSSPMPTILTNS